MRSQWINIILLVLLITVSFIAVDQIDADHSQETVEQIEKSIQKAAITCYAMEGSYASLDYLVEHYGIILQPEKYYYFYEYIAGNIMPEIKVFKK